MRSLIALVALVFALPVYAQPAQDANPRAEQNTQGATQNPDAMDPGKPNRRSLPAPAEPQIGEPRQEKSAGRDEGRTVGGATR